MPTIQGTDAFDHGFDVPADYDATFGTPTAVASPLYQGRNYSLEINSPGNEGVRKNYTGSPTRTWAGFAVYTNSLPPGPAGVTIFGMQSAASDVARVYFDASVGIAAYTSTGSSSSTAITLTTFNWIEVIFNVAANPHTMFWQVNGSNGPSVPSHAVAASTVDFNQLVALAGDDTLSFYIGGYWAWGTASSDSDWLGEPGTRMSPTGFMSAMGW